jgi:hypothetical protein
MADEPVAANQRCALLSAWGFGGPARRRKPKNMWKWFLHALLLTSLFLGGVDRSQGQADLQDRGQQQLLQTGMVNQEQQSLDLSADRHNSQAKDRKPLKGADLKKSKTPGSLKADAVGPSSSQYGMSHAQSQGPQWGALGSGLSAEEGSQSSSLDSASFLDGYLMNSLQEDKVVSQKAKEDNTPNNNLKANKKRSLFIK